MKTLNFASFRALFTAALLCIALVHAASTASAQTPDRPFVSTVFTDNMVVQRDMDVPFWGWTRPRQKVTVSFDGKSGSALADADGKWMVRLGPFKAGGPYDALVTGPQSVMLRNVLVGDVWICSGQSNMEFGIGMANNAAAEIAQADYPLLRFLLVGKNPATRPQTGIDGAWQVCTPTTIAQGGWNGFSAVAYFFGRKLQQDEKVPIGLIGTYWGGTNAEAWTSLEALKTIPDFQQPIADFIHCAGQGATTTSELVTQWQARNDLSSTSVKALSDPAYDDSGWKSIAVPGYWDATNIGRMTGSVWFRTTFNVPASWVGKVAELDIGTVADADDTFVNGTRVGGANGAAVQRVYSIPATLLHAGRNSLVVRVLSNGGPGGICGKADDMKLSVPGDTTDSPIPLAGEWRYGAKDLSPIIPDNHTITALYNGMIAPLIPFGIKGAIWYQGEGNSYAPDQYRVLLPTMIQDWRHRFRQGQFPFLIVQLANLVIPHGQPPEPDWPGLRESQAITARTLPNCALAVTVDIGDPGNIHPADKQDVGYRLALGAEALAYGSKTEYSGPVFRSARVEGKTMRLTFDHVGDGLMVKGGGKLLGFVIAGADGKFVPADAVIDGKTIVVSSPQVDSPTQARYAWDDNPVCNLYNRNGLPAVPFRTNPPAAPPTPLRAGY